MPGASPHTVFPLISVTLENKSSTQFSLQSTFLKIHQAKMSEYQPEETENRRYI